MRRGRGPQLRHVLCLHSPRLQSPCEGPPHEAPRARRVLVAAFRPKKVEETEASGGQVELAGMEAGAPTQLGFRMEVAEESRVVATCPC